MKFEINWAIVIFIFGLVGLVMSFADQSGQLGSKIPLTVFFMFVMCLGIGLQMLPRDWMETTFGEVGPPREFG